MNSQRKIKNVHLNIPPNKLKKLIKGNNVQLQRHELGEDMEDSDGEFEVEDKLLRKIKKARRIGKGARIEGGKINWKKVGTQVAIGVEAAKKVIPEKVAKNIAGKAGMAMGSAGAALIGMNPEVGARLGKTLTTSIVDSAYDTDFRDKNALKQFGSDIGKDVAKEGLKNITKSIGGGSLDYIVLDKSLGVQGRIYKNGNPLLKGMKSSESIFNQGNNIRNIKPIRKVINKEKVSGGSFRENRSRVLGGSFRSPGQ